MGRNVGKTHMEANLGRSLSAHQGKIIAAVATVVLLLLAWSSRDYLSEYGGVVATVGLDNTAYTVRRRTRKKFQVTCAWLRMDGATESERICNEDPQVFRFLKPRHRFIKPRFQRYMKAVGEEIEVDWADEAVGEGADGGVPAGGQDAGTGASP